MDIKNIIFDFGGVLIDWNPRYFYNDIFTDKSEMEFFLENICNSEWVIKQDSGGLISETTKQLQTQYPRYKNEIELFYKGWVKMLNGEIIKHTKLIKPLKNKYRLFGLTNWSAETFPIALEKFAFLKEFEGIVVSGQEKMVKPDKRIFELLLNRYQLQANESLFIDDNLNNITTAKELGFFTIHINNSTDLNKELIQLGLL